ncbi:MAG: ankyrin repeat domain-containing protein [Rhizobiaceae bacterium]
MSKFVLGLAISLASVSTHAQVAPAAGEISAYEGMLRAAHQGDLESIRRLIAAGSDVNVTDTRGRSPIHIAAYESNDQAMRVLADAGADMNALEGQAYDVVTIAAVANDPELMSLAIELGNSPQLITSPYEGTALIAAAHLGHVEIVKELIGAGAPLDHVNNLGWTALMEAVVLGDGGTNHQAVVSSLIEAGADRTISDRDGKTPLQHAQARGYVEIARLLQHQKP